MATAVVRVRRPGVWAEGRADGMRGPIRHPFAGRVERRFEWTCLCSVDRCPGEQLEGGARPYRALCPFGGRAPWVWSANNLQSVGNS